MSNLSQENLQELHNFYAWKRQRQIDESFTRIFGAFKKAKKMAGGVRKVGKGVVGLAKGVKKELTDPTTGLAGSIHAGIVARDFQLDRLRQDIKTQNLTKKQIKQRRDTAYGQTEIALRGLKGRIGGTVKVNLDTIRDGVKQSLDIQGSQRSRANPPNPNEGIIKKGIRVIGGAVYDTAAQRAIGRYPTGDPNIIPDEIPNAKDLFTVNMINRLRNLVSGTPLEPQSSWKAVNPKTDPMRKAQKRAARRLNRIVFPPKKP